MKVTLRKSVESKIRANARRGARALDKINKDWYKQDNLALSRLDMESGCQCVWGQLGSKDNFRENEAFSEAYNKSYGTATPGYVPNFDPDDSEAYYVSPECNKSRLTPGYDTFAGETDEERELRYAVQEEEFRVLQNEWEALIRTRRSMYGSR